MTKSTGKWYNVNDINANQSIPCVLRGNFKTKIKFATNPIAVGDIVDYTIDAGGCGIIHHIHKRDNYIIRRSIKNKHKMQIMASNIDQIIILATLKSPVTSLGFIDRILVTAESYHIKARVIFNKKDLYNNQELCQLKQLVDLYSSLGYSTIDCSCLHDKDIPKLLDVFKDKLSLMVGHSGVGKSTLLNHITGTKIQKTTGISYFSDKGVHTTTYAEIFQLEQNISIIDSPGIKEWALVDIEADELGGNFPDIVQNKKSCKFHNCLHDQEPKCGIKDAVENGTMAKSRYNSYMSMLHPFDNRR